MEGVLDRTGLVRSASGSRRRRAIKVTSVVTIGSLAVLIDLLLIGHTQGEQLWGPATAALAVLTGLLSLALLAVRGRRRSALAVLYALWATVAFFGYGGYNDHRLARSGAAIADEHQPPLIAPLMFIAWGIAGAASIRYASKED